MWGGPGLEGAFGQLDLVDAGSLGWIAECLLTDILHNIHYAKCCIGPFPGSLALAGVGSSSGSALASPLGHPTRTRSQHDRERRFGLADEDAGGFMDTHDRINLTGP